MGLCWLEPQGGLETGIINLLVPELCILLIPIRI